MNNSLITIFATAAVVLAISIGAVNAINTTQHLPTVIADDTTIVKQGIFENFLALKKYGVTNDQIEETKNLIGDYLANNKIEPTSVTLTPDSIDCGKTHDQCTFDISIDNKELKAEIGYTIFSAYRLALSTSEGSIIFSNDAVEPQGGHNEG